MLRPLWRVGYSQSTINQTMLGRAGALCGIHYVSFRSQTGKERMEGLGEWCGAPDPGLPSILDIQTPKKESHSEAVGTGGQTAAGHAAAEEGEGPP